MSSRRTFIKTSALGSIAVSGILPFDKVWGKENSISQLHIHCEKLLNEWADAVLRLQVTDVSKVSQYGGIFCPADNAVHGRSGDTIYPFLHLAETNKQSRYLDAAILLYRWMEKHVSQPDGSWLNEPVANSWKGTTVFAVISLAEAIKHHGSILDNVIKNEMINRLHKAGDFIYKNIDFKYGNVNYPISAAYGMSLLGTVLDNKTFSNRGKQLAHEALGWFTKKDKLLYGEGDMLYEPSKKGCLAIDLGYNVEESLPALVQYALLNNDTEVLETVIHSMKQHLAFMLPDGAWDNSWGTRNFKWTYWGSRTSDGCQTAYALLADREPVFYKAALANTLLWKKCTNNGLLTGGPHYANHGVATCVHHTFSHMKSLTTVLNYPSKYNIDPSKLLLPREKEYGIRFFEDIQTWLVSKGLFRATVTAYDKEYKKTKNGHPSGGALSLLWHKKTGVLFAAGMNEYQLYEAGNMQRDTDPFSMPLAPRAELKKEGIVYMNISDLSAAVTVNEQKNMIVIKTTSHLVDKDQRNPGKPVSCNATYTFHTSKLVMDFVVEGAEENEVNIILPLVSSSNEKINIVSGKEIFINKEKAKVRISANTLLQQPPSNNGRIFNYVPGFEAIPFVIKNNKATVEIEVL